MPAIYAVLTVAVTGVAYVLTPQVLGLVTLFGLLLGQADLQGWFPDRWSSAAVMMSGLVMSTIPYVAGGLFVSRVHLDCPWPRVAILGLITALVERVAILGGGYLTYLSYRDLFKGQYWLEVIQGEALPYYTPAYIGFGLVVSPLAMTVAARLYARRLQSRAHPRAT